MKISELKKLEEKVDECNKYDSKTIVISLAYAERVIEYVNRLEKTLDNAIKECCIGVTGSDACNSLEELYKYFESKVWKDVD